MENYHAALTRFKIYDSTVVDSSDDEDERLTIYLKAPAVKLIGSLLAEQQIL